MSETEEESSEETSTGEGAANNYWPITEEWLQLVLKDHHHHNQSHDNETEAVDIKEDLPLKIINFTVQPGCGSGESVLSDILAVTVSYALRDNNYDRNFIVKLLPQDPFSRFFVTEAQFDLREVKFYTQIVPDLIKFKDKTLSDNDQIHLPIPKCFYANYNAGDLDQPEPSPPSSVLVLENIKLKGYEAAEFSKGLDLKQAQSAIEAIAQIHALSLVLKIDEGKPLSEKYPFLFQTSKASDSYQQLVERGLPQLFQFLETKNDFTEILKSLNNIRPHTKTIIENLLKAEEPMALITHTDFWCNNLMFRETTTGSKTAVCQCAILDWQMVCYSRPTNDLALLLVSSVSTDLRRTYTDQLLDLYWEKLTSTCRQLKVDIEERLEYDRGKLGEDYRKAQLLALLLCIGSIDLAIGNPEMEDRLVELLKDLNNEGLLNV